ncbi:MAG: S41 family peptidase [Pseudomonadota bacterium]
MIDFVRALQSLLIVSCLAACVQHQATRQSVLPMETSAQSDVSTLCAEIRERYAYFEDRAGHWDAACARASEDISAAASPAARLAVLERLLDDLYDPHVNLSANSQSSPRLVPSGSDLWFNLIDGDFVVAAVRKGSGAAQADVKIGDRLLRFNGHEPHALWKRRVHTVTGEVPEHRKLWALNAAIAGRYDAPRRIELMRDGTTRALDLGDPIPTPTPAPVSSEIIGPGIGYIRFNNSLGNESTIESFDQALDALRDTRALILDLRDTPSGGNTGVAEPILGRLISEEVGYQTAVYGDGSAITSTVQPRGPWTYDQPIVVLCGRWTGSMGEGIVIGLDGIRRAKVMGSAMAGLAGGTQPIDLPESGLQVWVPTYDLRHLGGTPRHRWKPQENPIDADFGNGRDILLEEVVRFFDIPED